MMRSMLRRRVMMGATKKACGVALGSLAVGDMLTLNMNGDPKTFIVAHKGAPAFSGSSLVEYSGFDGGVIVLGLGASQFWSGGVPVWDTWADDVWQVDVVPLAEQLFDQDVVDAIMRVSIPYRMSASTAWTATYQSVWVPSASEYGYDTLDGGTFDYFAESTTRAERIKAAFSGEYVEHATRSGYEGTQYNIYYSVSTAGKVGSTRTSPTHCRFCLVLPEDFVVKVPE